MNLRLRYILEGALSRTEKMQFGTLINQSNLQTSFCHIFILSSFFDCLLFIFAFLHCQAFHFLPISVIDLFEIKKLIISNYRSLSWDKVTDKTKKTNAKYITSHSLFLKALRHFPAWCFSNLFVILRSVFSDVATTTPLSMISLVKALATVQCMFTILFFRLYHKARNINVIITRGFCQVTGFY